MRTGCNLFFLFFLVVAFCSCTEAETDGGGWRIFILFFGDGGEGESGKDAFFDEKGKKKKRERQVV